MSTLLGVFAYVGEVGLGHLDCLSAMPLTRKMSHTLISDPVSDEDTLQVDRLSTSGLYTADAKTGRYRP